MSEEPLSEETRAVLTRTIPQAFSEEWLLEYMEAVKGITRGISVDHTCEHCDKRGKVYVQIPNFSEINKTIMDLWNQAFGRPGVAEGEPGGVTIIVERSSKVALNGDGPSPA